jgi:hypothetical protein
MVVGLDMFQGPEFRDTSVIPAIGDFQGMLPLACQTSDSENRDLSMSFQRIACTCGPGTAYSLGQPSGGWVLTTVRTALFIPYHIRPNFPSWKQLHRRM